MSNKISFLILYFNYSNILSTLNFYTAKSPPSIIISSNIFIKLFNLYNWYYALKNSSISGNSSNYVFENTLFNRFYAVGRLYQSNSKHKTIIFNMSRNYYYYIPNFSIIIFPISISDLIHHIYFTSFYPNNFNNGFLK